MLVNNYQWGFISTPFVPVPLANRKFQTLACETRRLQGTLAFNEKSLRQLGKKISFPQDTEEAKIKWTFHSFQPTSDFSRRKNIDNESSFFYFFPERGEMSNRVIGEISLACLLFSQNFAKSRIIISLHLSHICNRFKSGNNRNQETAWRHHLSLIESS